MRVDSLHATPSFPELLSVSTAKRYDHLAQVRNTGDFFEDARHSLALKLRVKGGQDQSNGLNSHEVAKGRFQRLQRMDTEPVQRRYDTCLVEV